MPSPYSCYSAKIEYNFKDNFAMKFEMIVDKNIEYWILKLRKPGNVNVI